MESNGLVVRRLIKVDFREFDYFIRIPFDFYKVSKIDSTRFEISNDKGALKNLQSFKRNPKEDLYLSFSERF